MSAAVAYLRARYDEEEEFCRHSAAAELDHLPTIECKCGRRIHLGAPPRQLADIQAKREVLDLHELLWPVVIETVPAVELQPGPDVWVAHVSQEITWTTADRYRIQFGKEPPPTAMIRALLRPYADRDDFDPAWREN